MPSKVVFLVFLLCIEGCLLALSSSNKRPLFFQDINFLHTTDTHGWLSGHLNQNTYNADWGDFVALVEHFRKSAAENNQDLLVVDSGDRHDGNGLSDITTPNGERSLPVFMQQHYDIITLGNHELYLWENSKQEVDLLMPHYKNNYICSNVEFERDGKWYPFGQKFSYFTTRVRKQRILAFSFLFDFDRANNRTRVTPIAEAFKQDWFASVVKHYPQSEVDMVVVVGHIPVDKRWTELGLLHDHLRSYYPKANIQYFGGHSHIRDFQVYDERLTGLQSGRFCETLGFLSVNTTKHTVGPKDRYFRSYIDFSRELFLFHSGKSTEEFQTAKSVEVKEMLSLARDELGLEKVLGQVSRSNYYMDYVPLMHPKNLYNLLTSKVLPTLEPEGKVAVHDERLVIINTGSVRYDLYQGPYTVDSHFIVSPFQNDWVKVSVPKRVAIRIAPLLNENGYIVTSEGNRDLAYLRPPHQRAQSGYNGDQSDQQVMMYEGLTYPDFDHEANVKKLTKGYVTYDEFGHDGDDTPHKGVVTFPLPNVVQSVEFDLKTGEDTVVDVVFYSFLIPNIEWAMGRIGYAMPEVELYSKKYLGLLLDEYIGAHHV